MRRRNVKADSVGITRCTTMNIAPTNTVAGHSLLIVRSNTHSSSCLKNISLPFLNLGTTPCNAALLLSAVVQECSHDEKATQKQYCRTYSLFAPFPSARWDALALRLLLQLHSHQQSRSTATAAQRDHEGDEAEDEEPARCQQLHCTCVMYVHGKPAVLASERHK